MQARVVLVRSDPGTFGEGFTGAGGVTASLPALGPPEARLEEAPLGSEGPQVRMGNTGPPDVSLVLEMGGL